MVKVEAGVGYIRDYVICRYLMFFTLGGVRD